MIGALAASPAAVSAHGEETARSDRDRASAFLIPGMAADLIGAHAGQGKSGALHEGAGSTRALPCARPHASRGAIDLRDLRRAAGARGNADAPPGAGARVLPDASDRVELGVAHLP